MTYPQDEMETINRVAEQMLPGWQIAPLDPLRTVIASNDGILLGSIKLTSMGWVLGVTAGILHGIRNLQGAVIWANELNRSPTGGCYQCYFESLDGSGNLDSAIILHTSWISSDLFDDHPEAARWLVGNLMNESVGLALDLPKIGLQVLDGKVFFPGEKHDIQALMFATQWGD